jgi:hypothetical protein
MSDSDDSNHPTRPARVPLDKVQGTDDVSCRLRRQSFRGLRPRAPVDVRLRRFKSSDTTHTGALGQSPRNRRCQPSTPASVVPWTSSTGTRWSSTLTVEIIRHDPLMSDSDDSDHSTRPTRVPLDEVQGTDDVSRRLRRPPFRGLRPRAPVGVRLRRFKSSDTTPTGALGQSPRNGWCQPSTPTPAVPWTSSTGTR